MSYEDFNLLGKENGNIFHSCFEANGLKELAKIEFVRKDKKKMKFFNLYRILFQKTHLCAKENVLGKHPFENNQSLQKVYRM